MRDMIYDIETYPNVFTIAFKDTKTHKTRVFEMSDWVNDWAEFKAFAKECANGMTRWVGFNNYAFDYPVVHYMLANFKVGTSGSELARQAKIKATRLIECSKEEKHLQMIWDNNHIVPQVDLFKIHHFDNVARATSLKVLEFNMQSHVVEDLPYHHEKVLTKEERDVLVKYNLHDVDQTYQFYLKSADMIAFREKLSKKYSRNFLNHNDTKIGKDFFIMELEAAGVKCYTFGEDGRKPIQTKRPVIAIKDVIFPYIRFQRPEFRAVLRWLQRQRITQTKGVFTELTDFHEISDYIDHDEIKLKIRGKTGKVQSKNLRTIKFPTELVTLDEKILYAKSKYEVVSVELSHLHVVVDGFKFDFGTGGIHGSVDSTIVCADGDNEIIDDDVISLYPSIGIANGLFPKHLSNKFCEIYAQLKKDRVGYAKGTPENAMLKLALNGVYGDSNNQFSPFYDPQYTMAITVNGQLMLCMLAEMLMTVPSVKVIQINTDGVTYKVKSSDVEKTEALKKEWENITKLDLERADYSRMFIRDVNNYIGEYTDGKLKRKGAYEYEIDWHQNHSSLVVQKAVEAHLTKDTPIREFIESHDDVYDFMLRTKIPRTSRLMCGDVQVQNVTRYYMSTDGGALTKIMPPLPKNPDKERHIGVNKGFKATPMNTMGEVINIDHTWYIERAEALTTPLISGAFNDLMNS